MAENIAAVPAPAAVPGAATPAPVAPAAPATPAPAAGDPTAVAPGATLIGGADPVAPAPATPAPGAPATPAPVAPAEITDASKIPGYDKAAVDKAITDKLTAEGKSATEIADAIKAADAEAIANAKPGAPAEYKDFTMPADVQMDPAMVNDFKAIAKSLNLNQHQAQGLVDLQSRYAKAQGEAILTQFRQTVENWKQETVLALGPGYKEELGIAAKAIERFGDPELRQILNETGLGNHKAVVSFFNKIGKAISEDSFADGGKSKVGAKTDGEIFYPGMPK
jgi:hypothetical protein